MRSLAVDLVVPMLDNPFHLGGGRERLGPHQVFMGMIQFKCQRCGSSIKVADNLAGKKGKCPGCKETIEVPRPSSSPADELDLVPVDEGGPARTPAKPPAPAAKPPTPASKPAASAAVQKQPAAVKPSAPPTKPKPPPPPEDDDDVVEAVEEDEEEVEVIVEAEPPRKGRKPTPRDDEDEEPPRKKPRRPPRAEDEEDVEEVVEAVEEDEDEERPRKGRKRAVDEDEEEEEEPPRKRRKKPAAEEEAEDEDDRPRRKGKKRRRSRGPRGDYADCPECGAPGNATKVYYTWWGGFLGPIMLNHVRCDECGAGYNGSSGNSNKTAITLFIIFDLLIITMAGVLLILQMLE